MVRRFRDPKLYAFEPEDDERWQDYARPAGWSSDWEKHDVPDYVRRDQEAETKPDRDWWGRP
jgi:hypothetical protein